jgi:imidazolonepropionase-like amidohydrolase
VKTLAAFLICMLPLAAGTEDSFLLRGATVHTISGASIENGSILVQNGKIMGVGQKLTAPKGVRVIEGKSMHVYPGIIDSGTEVGLSEIGAVRETNDASEMGDFNPELRALVAVNPSSEHIPVIRANGITSVITMPQGGLIAGQASLMHMDGWTWEEMEIKRSAAMHIRFPVLGARPDGSGGAESGFRTPARIPYLEAKKDYDAKIRTLHDYFEQARRYQKAKAAGGPAFQPDLKLEAMLPVIEGKQAVMMTAVRERAIRDAVEFADKEKIRIVLADVREPGKMLAVLKEKKIPVILGPTLELPLREDDPYDAAFTLPAELYKAGVKFAFASFSNEFSRNLPYQAANAVAYGLPYDEALKALTLNAAEIWDVGDKMGSIDEGKWADLVVTDGDPLETKTQVKLLFIKGKPVDLENKHHLLYEKYMNRPTN